MIALTKREDETQNVIHGILQTYVFIRVRLSLENLLTQFVSQN